RSEEHTSELQSLTNLVCRLLLEKNNETDSTGLQRRCSGRGFSYRALDGGRLTEPQVLSRIRALVFFFNDTATTEIYTLSLHDALPISVCNAEVHRRALKTTRNRSNFRNRSEEHTSELQSLTNLVCRLLLEKKKTS